MNLHTSFSIVDSWHCSVYQHPIAHNIKINSIVVSFMHLTIHFCNCCAYGSREVPFLKPFLLQITPYSTITNSRQRSPTIAYYHQSPTVADDRRQSPTIAYSHQQSPMISDSAIAASAIVSDRRWMSTVDDTVFSLNDRTAKKNSKRACPEIFRAWNNSTTWVSGVN